MTLRTKLSLEDCKARLRSATDLRGLALSWDAKTPGTVVGEFRGSAFRLHTMKYYNNPFAPLFYGNLTDGDGGAILEGRFRMNPLVRLCMLFWLAFLVLFGVGAIIVPAPLHPFGGIGRGWLFAGLAFLALLGVGLIALGKWLGRSEEAVVHSFLKNTLVGGQENPP